MSCLAFVNGLRPHITCVPGPRHGAGYRAVPKAWFTVRRYEGPDVYAYAERDGIELHLAQVNDLKPRRNMSAVYLYVDDADALYGEWSQAGIDGRVLEPSDTSYGLRERACLDRDGNLIRFGSGIPDRD